MGRWLPALYGLVLLGETAALSVVYAVFRPSAADPISVWLGTLGLASMVIMLVYSVARRSRALRQLARLSYWLHLHIFLGLQGVLFVAFHSLPMLYRFPAINILNPGFLNGASVTVVFLSGLFGRYLYAQVPKTIGGQHMAAREVEAELKKSHVQLPPEVVALWKQAPTPGSILGVIRADFARRAAGGKLRRMQLPDDVRSLGLRRLQLQRQRAALHVAQRWFRVWIFLHRPVALAMYSLTFVHIALALMFSPHLRFF